MQTVCRFDLSCISNSMPFASELIWAAILILLLAGMVTLLATVTFAQPKLATIGP